jgi:hypothetical protein
MLRLRGQEPLIIPHWKAGGFWRVATVTARLTQTTCPELTVARRHQALPNRTLTPTRSPLSGYPTATGSLVTVPARTAPTHPPAPILSLPADPTPDLGCSRNPRDGTPCLCHCECEAEESPCGAPGTWGLVGPSTGLHVQANPPAATPLPPLTPAARTQVEPLPGPTGRASTVEAAALPLPIKASAIRASQLIAGMLQGPLPT